MRLEIGVNQHIVVLNTIWLVDEVLYRDALLSQGNGIYTPIVITQWRIDELANE